MEHKRLKGILCLLLVHLSGCGKSDLYTNLPEKEANEMISILSQRGIVAEKFEGKESTFIVKVEADNFSKAVEILNIQGYPHVKYQTIGQVFAKAGLVSSPLEERARFMYALSEDIAATLCDIPGVLTARVHLVLPENDPYTEVVVPSSAAVCITYRPDTNVEDYIREIKYLVTNSIEGLDYDRVSVALFPASFSLNSLQKTTTGDTVRFLGFEVTPEQKLNLLAIISSTAITLLLLLTLIVFILRRKIYKKAAAEGMTVLGKAPEAVPPAEDHKH